MTTELELWEQYQKGIKKENDAITKLSDKLYASARKEYDAKVKAHYRNLEEREKDIQKRQRRNAEIKKKWDNSSWLYKFFNEEPWYESEYVSLPYFPSAPFYLGPTGLKKATYEDFLDWQLKNRQ